VEIFDIHYAKKHLSRLIEKAARGEAFIIARAGKPLVKMVSLDASAPREINPIGFMKGRIKVPDDFDRICESEIARLFEGSA
jgi:antitoxin (DNA-binding transcriptional repressor) of toxin-antitoxin stability system